MTARNLFSLARERTSPGLAKGGLPRFCARAKGEPKSKRAIAVATAKALPVKRRNDASGNARETSPGFVVWLVRVGAWLSLCTIFLFALFTLISFRVAKYLFERCRSGDCHRVLSLLEVPAHFIGKREREVVVSGLGGGAAYPEPPDPFGIRLLDQGKPRSDASRALDHGVVGLSDLKELIGDDILLHSSRHHLLRWVDRLAFGCRLQRCVNRGEYWEHVDGPLLIRMELAPVINRRLACSRRRYRALAGVWRWGGTELIIGERLIFIDEPRPMGPGPRWVYRQTWIQVSEKHVLSDIDRHCVKRDHAI